MDINNLEKVQFLKTELDDLKDLLNLSKNHYSLKVFIPSRWPFGLDKTYSVKSELFVKYLEDRKIKVEEELKDLGIKF